MVKMIKIYLVLLFISLGLSIFLYELKPVEEMGRIEVVIQPGEGLDDIAGKLKVAGLIRSKIIFKIYSFLSGAAIKLKPGSYFFESSEGIPDILKILIAGPAEDIQITILEGEDLEKIDKKFSDFGIIKRRDILSLKTKVFFGDFVFLKDGKSLDGFLFPDTYRFFPASNPEEIVKKFLINFQRKALPILKEAQIEVQGRFLTLYDLLILASLIEKEVPFHNDRLLVSGVLLNRLEIGMPLQVDAAPETYKSYGLPDKPIANPGFDAIYAATHPKKSDYFYYLSDPKTRKTIFSRTFDEHSENRAKYLKK